MEVHRVEYAPGSLPDCPEWLVRAFGNHLGTDIKELMREPACTIVVVNGETKIYYWRTPKVFWEWYKQPELLFDGEAVFRLSSYAYAESEYLTVWDKAPTQNSCLQTGDDGIRSYDYQGLSALRELFMHETGVQNVFQNIQLSQHGLSFLEWQKRYYLALLKFGASGSSQGVGSQILPLFQFDKKFVTAHGDAINNSRPELKAFKWFALAWDKYYVPLRFWSKTAAWCFMVHLKQNAGSQTEFTRKFYNQRADPINNRAPGLYGLVPFDPPVVVKWQQGKNPLITVSKRAAEQYGFSVDACRDVLGNDLGIQVILK